MIPDLGLDYPTLWYKLLGRKRDGGTTWAVASGGLAAIHPTEPVAGKWKRFGLDDDDLRVLEWSIMVGPTAYPVVRGTGGLRKMRFAPPSLHTGKRGALRVCYAFFEEHSIVLLALFFAKNEKENLSAAERKEVATVIAEIKAELDAEPSGRRRRR